MKSTVATKVQKIVHFLGRAYFKLTGYVLYAVQVEVDGERHNVHHVTVKNGKVTACVVAETGEQCKGRKYSGTCCHSTFVQALEDAHIEQERQAYLAECEKLIPVLDAYLATAEGRADAESDEDAQPKEGDVRATKSDYRWYPQRFEGGEWLYCLDVILVGTPDAHLHTMWFYTESQALEYAKSEYAGAEARCQALHQASKARKAEAMFRSLATSDTPKMSDAEANDYFMSLGKAEDGRKAEESVHVAARIVNGQIVECRWDELTADEQRAALSNVFEL